jgi:Co/Zn/Cd efflux system component
MSTGRPSHALTEQKRPLRIALAITVAMMLVEAAGRFLSRSLALLEVLTSVSGIRHSTLQT